MRQVIVAFWVLAAVLGCFAPMLQTLVWHLRYDNAIRYGGKNIPVPTRWIASTEPEGVLQGVELTKLPVSLLFADRPQGLISLSQSQNRPGETPEEISKSWVSMYWTLHAGSDDVVVGPLKVGSGTDDTVCMELFNRRVLGQASASCLLFHGKWTAEFFGDKKDISSFFEIVRRVG